MINTNRRISLMWRRHAAPTRELNAFIDIDSMYHVQQVYTLQPEVPPFFAEHAQSTLGICAQVLKEPSTACNTEDYSYKKGRQKLLLSHCCGAVGAASLLFLMLFWCAQVRTAGGFGAWIPGWVVARLGGGKARWCILEVFAFARHLPSGALFAQPTTRSTV